MSVKVYHPRYKLTQYFINNNVEKAYYGREPEKTFIYFHKLYLSLDRNFNY